MKADERIVVVGGGLAALRAAERLRQLNFDGGITILSEERYRPYHRPALSKQILTGELRPRDLGLEAYLELDAVWRFGARAIKLDPARHVVELPGNEELRYDGLVVATGVHARHMPGAPRHDPRVHVLRDLRDAVQIQRNLRKGHGPVAVIGGGFTACEIASTVKSLGREVTIVHRSKLLCNRVFGNELASQITELQREHGVRLALGAEVTHWMPQSWGVGMYLSTGQLLVADCVILAIGSVPTTQWLRGSGLDIEDGVLCRPTCHVQGVSDVVAAGDVARWPNLRFEAVPRRLEHWINAVEMGRHAAESLLAGATDAKPFTPLPRFWTEMHHIRLQAAGMPTLGQDSIQLSGKPGKRGVVGQVRGGRLIGVVGWDSPRGTLRWTAELERELLRPWTASQPAIPAEELFEPSTTAQPTEQPQAAAEPVAVSRPEPAAWAESAADQESASPTESVSRMELAAEAMANAAAVDPMLERQVSADAFHAQLAQAMAAAENETTRERIPHEMRAAAWKLAARELASQEASRELTAREPFPAQPLPRDPMLHSGPVDMRPIPAGAGAGPIAAAGGPGPFATGRQNPVAPPGWQATQSGPIPLLANAPMERMEQPVAQLAGRGPAGSGFMEPVARGPMPSGQMAPVGPGAMQSGQMAPVGPGAMHSGHMAPVGPGAMNSGHMAPVGGGAAHSGGSHSGYREPVGPPRGPGAGGPLGSGYREPVGGGSMGSGYREPVAGGPGGRAGSGPGGPIDSGFREPIGRGPLGSGHLPPVGPSSEWSAPDDSNLHSGPFWQQPLPRDPMLHSGPISPGPLVTGPMQSAGLDDLDLTTRTTRPPNAHHPSFDEPTFDERAFEAELANSAFTQEPRYDERQRELLAPSRRFLANQGDRVSESTFDEARFRELSRELSFREPDTSGFGAPLGSGFSAPVGMPPAGSPSGYHAPVSRRDALSDWQAGRPERDELRLT